MARTIDVTFARKVEDTFYTMTQQKVSVFEPRIDMETGIVGKSVDRNRIGDAEAFDMQENNGFTKYVDLAFSKRRANMQPKAWAYPLDDFDQAMQTADPKSPITAKCVEAINRACDRHWITQILGNAIVVSAADAESNQALTLTIANGGTSLTLDKLREIVYDFDLYEVPLEDRHIAISAYAKRSLLKYAEIGSRDYNPEVGAFVSGKIPTLFGLQPVLSNLLPKTGNIRSLVAWAKPGFKGFKGKVQEVWVGQNPARWNNWEIQGKVIVGGVRLDENLVVQCDIDETA